MGESELDVTSWANPNWVGIHERVRIGSEFMGESELGRNSWARIRIGAEFMGESEAGRNLWANPNWV